MRWSPLLLAAACSPKVETGPEDVDLAPVIAFTSPADDASIAAGSAVTLAVSLTDEDVPALDLAWSSTVSGPLVGEEVRNSTSASLTLPTGLAVGSHTITVTATDAAGQAASDTLLLTVTDGADGDLDGWGADDCDDADPGVHPGAPELCDGVDQDCDKEVDEGATDAVTVYADLDGDGFGAGPGALGCVGAGSSLNDDDCDDADATVSPDGVEVCDADLRDEDCDGLVNGDDPDSAGGEVNTWYRDGDGDGFGADAGSVEACSPPSGYVAAGGDCDDADAAVSPAEPEVCDAADVDEDCDGTADDDDASVSDAGSWYTDDDGDGYGGGSPVVSCDPVPGASPIGGDCDDGDADVSPAEVERCDPADVDEDCSGAADDDDPAALGATTWYADGDGDGVGGTSGVWCDPPAGWEATGGDCDDADPTVSPAEPDRCEDGGDQDCDGLDAVCGSDPYVIAYGAATSRLLGDIQPVVADLDLDGAPDLIAPFEGDELGYVELDGSVLLFRGPLRDDVFATGAHLIDAAGTDTRAPHALAADVGSDGIGDLIVVAAGASDPVSGATNAGVLYRIPDPWSASSVVGDATTRWIGDAALSGMWGATVGDEDGDGEPDLLVGMYTNYGFGDYGGRAYLVHGPHADGDVWLAAEASTTFEGVDTDDAATKTSLLGPDLDGDGHGDVALGAPEADVGGPDSGSVYLFWSHAAVELLSAADGIWSGVDDDEQVGLTLADVGDVDGDGRDDVLMGSRYGAYDIGPNSGVVYVVSGTTAGGNRSLSAAPLRVDGVEDIELGMSATGVDYDGDGTNDLVVGAPGRDVELVGWSYNSTRAGQALVFLMPRSGALGAADADDVLDGRELGDEFGTTLTVGDFDYDGAVDLIVGAGYADTAVSDEGEITMFPLPR